MTDRQQFLASAVAVEIVTVVWMFVEGGVSLGAGVAAGSIALIAFGADSGIELVTAVALLWRLTVERNQHHAVRIASAERTAAWIVAVALVLLCLYVIAGSSYNLLMERHAESSAWGIGIAIAAVVVMPLLAQRKLKLARALDSVALRGDAACSVTCAYMAGALLVGLVAEWLTGWWWVDDVLALTLLFWLIPAAKEAIEGARHGTLECGCADDDSCEQKPPSEPR